MLDLAESSVLPYSYFHCWKIRSAPTGHKATPGTSQIYPRLITNPSPRRLAVYFD